MKDQGIDDIRIGFIGIGVMGAPMVANLAASGYAVTVYDTDRARASGCARHPGVEVAGLRSEPAGPPTSSSPCCPTARWCAWWCGVGRIGAAMQPAPCCSIPRLPSRGIHPRHRSRARRGRRGHGRRAGRGTGCAGGGSSCSWSAPPRRPGAGQAAAPCDGPCGSSLSAARRRPHHEVHQQHDHRDDLHRDHRGTGIGKRAGLDPVAMNEVLNDSTGAPG